MPNHMFRTGDSETSFPSCLPSSLQNGHLKFAFLVARCPQSCPQERPGGHCPQHVLSLGVEILHQEDEGPGGRLGAGAGTVAVERTGSQSARALPLPAGGSGWEQVRGLGQGPCPPQFINMPADFILF